MELIKDQYFEGERPLYARRDGLRLESVSIGPGESSLKEGADIEAENCEFNGKYQNRSNCYILLNPKVQACPAV